MSRDSLAARRAAALKWLLPTCLSVSGLGRRGKGRSSLSNLKPRVNPPPFVPGRASQGRASTQIPFLTLCWGGGGDHFCLCLSFQGQTRGTARSRAPQLTNVCGLFHRRGKGERRQKKQRDHTFEVVGFWRKKPTFAFRVFWAAVTLLFKE